jgi:integrase
MTELITARTLRTAFADNAKRKRYDVSDARIANLQLRVKPSGVRWSIRVRLHGDQRRYDLGPAVAGDEDIGGLSLDGARARAMRVIEMARNGHNPKTFLAALATGVSIETQRKIEAERPERSWTWQNAKERFLAEVKRSNRLDTHRDYRGKLQPAELSRFDGRLVSQITRNEMAAAVAAVHARGAEAMSEGMVRVIKRFWSWLAEALRQDETSVADGVMIKLAAPPRTRVEIGEGAFDPEDERGDAPPEIEIGRALAIARLGCLPERVGLGLELLIGTVQRRRAVTGANRWRFRTYAEANDECAWYVPPYFRKSGTKRGRRSHLVPCVGFAAHAQERLDRMADFEGSEGWLFPASVHTKADRPHADPGLFNDYLQAMPGVGFSPHGTRYAFATYGERDLGFRPGEGKLILDHMEGVEPTDVTGQIYSSDPGIARKRTLMRAWTDWCDEWTAKAVLEDRSLLNRELLTKEIRERRYHKERIVQVGL